MDRYPTTHDLVEACLGGDEQAWRDLVHRFAPLVWSIARAHRLSPADCDDVSQATWVRLWRTLNRLREPDRLGEYLSVIAKREALRHLDAVARLRPGRDHDVAADVADAEPSAETALVSKERAAELTRALLQLPPRCQHMIALLVDGRSYEQIAAALDLAPGSVGPIRRRCLQHLRRAIEADRRLEERGRRDTTGCRLGAVP
ncbi:RNA polymerase sigma factor [Phytoactinopolyspora halotolerans]|uniref:Sigma-70 family RNA polymerase sigma factor n=1 Tax=Phytoactinopolyspora halotolerans TaxID=1981512 RepID=A0A6L9S256_9ACTN|nr:sigma-70 family RNA polymerase sigma factor [Phytoactinopolyspora halotolerans]NED99162.1 sigma-70 family RNA polymerase sigma factor [Phytoactinopolyspora halotolerans]